MKKKQKGGSQTIVWWIVWILLTIGSFFIAVSFWTPVIARRFGSVYETRAAVFWVVAVFGTWMIFLLPLIVLMYRKVDKAYEDARTAREKAANRFRSVLVEKSKRMLPPRLQEKLKDWPQILPSGHLVTVILQDGRRISNVFIQNQEEILGVYDFTELPFEAQEIVDLEPADLTHLPLFSANQWLRLDGVSAS